MSGRSAMAGSPPRLERRPSTPRVLPITEDVIFKWRLLVEEGRKAGHSFSQPDLLIAATALHHGLTVVTRGVDDYRKGRVPVFNPWSDPLPSGA